MKNIFFALLLILSFAQLSSAQSPSSFNYQAVVRDASGSVTANQSVAFRISILQSTATGTAVYSETHTTTTTSLGLANFKIGGGTVVSGNLSTIDWGSDDYFVKVELDAAGGTNYSTMGTSQLLSVPFAMYAKTSGDKIWEKSGNNTIYDNGNVGIGTASPAAKLDVITTATSTGEIVAKFGVSDATNDELTLTNATNVNGQFIPSLKAIRSSNNREVLFLSARTTSANDNGSSPLMSFVTGNTSSPIATRPLFQWKNYTSPMMTMTANGNLGIGTASPARKLHVTEAMRLQPSATAPSNPAAGDMYFSSANNKLMVYDGSTWQACW